MHPHRPPIVQHSSRLAASVIVCAFAVIATLPACKAKLGPANERDDVREQNQQLRDQVADLERRLELRTQQIEALRQADAASADARADMPDAEPLTLTTLKLDDYTGLIDNDGDGTPDVARAYVKPVEQRGRFTPVVGEALFQVVAMPDEAGGEPHVLAEKRYAPAEWEDAYRSSFTGTHYTLETPLDGGIPDDVSSVVLRVRFRQAETGITVSQQVARNVR